MTLDHDVKLRIDTYRDDALNRLLVEVALCNDQETPRKIPVNAWLFQTQLYVEAGGAAVFLPVYDVTVDERLEPDTELSRLNLQYRDRLEFAIGRTCSADWTVRAGERRATQVRTTWLPTSETPQTRAVEVEDAVLDMTKLADATTANLRAGLAPIVTAYGGWLDEREIQAKALPAHLRDEALDAVSEARRVHKQLADGVNFLLDNEEAVRCFGFMNKVMAEQRIHTQIAEARVKNPTLSVNAARQQVLENGPKAHSWRTFQLAFVLMQIRGLCEPSTPRRAGDLAKVELLFFPTGVARPRPISASPRSRSRSAAGRGCSTHRTGYLTARPG